MSLWSIITGAGKVGDVIDTGLDVVKQGMDGIDALVYTNEEQAKDAAEKRTYLGELSFKFAQLAQSEGGASAVTRRLFGLIVLINFTTYAQAALVAACFSRMDIVDNIVKTAIAIMLGEMAITVVVALFGYYGFTGVFGKGKKS